MSKGVVSGGGKSVTYGALIGGKNFGFTFPASQTSATPGQGVAKPVKDYKLVGTMHPRIDIPGKVSGQYTYVQNVRIPGMWHARWVTPRGIGANTSQNHFPISVDESSIKNIPGAQVVRIGNFLAVAAPKEYEAIQAAAQLKVVWKSDPKFGSGSSGNFWSWVRKAGDTNTIEPGSLHHRQHDDQRFAGEGREDRVGDLQVPLQQLRADRPARRDRGHRRPTAGACCTSRASRSRARRTSRRCSASAYKPENIRVDRLRGLELLRRRHAGAGSRAGSA